MSHSTGEATSRPTVARALVRFPCAQYTARDGERHRLIAGTRGTVGHGNVAGAGRAPLEHGDATPCHQGRNEQARVRAAVGHARRPDRPRAQAVTASIDPMTADPVTGAALATVNHLPVTLLPGDVFTTPRRPAAGTAGASGPVPPAAAGIREPPALSALRKEVPRDEGR